MRYKESKFNLPIYNANIVYIDTDDNNKLEKEWGIELDYKPHATVLIRDIHEGEMFKRTYFIILNTKSQAGNIGMGHLAHESFHLSNMILESKGAIATFDNDEPQAYLLQYLFNKGSKFFFNYT